MYCILHTTQVGWLGKPRTWAAIHSSDGVHHTPFLLVRGSILEMVHIYVIVFYSGRETRSSTGPLSQYLLFGRESWSSTSTLSQCLYLGENWSSTSPDCLPSGINSFYIVMMFDTQICYDSMTQSIVEADNRASTAMYHPASYVMKRNRWHTAITEYTEATGPENSIAFTIETTYLQ